jgi:hypothetical protein
MQLTIREYEEDPRGESATDYEFEYTYSPSSASSDNFTCKTPPNNKSSGSFLPTGTFSSLKRMFVQLFLPIGYPHSVDPTYLEYQLFDSLQGLCSYLRSVVSSSAVLKASGVGNATVTAMSAAMAWALRDGIGMVGGLLFSYVASDLFDTHVKEFRLFADIINDFAMALDMLAPYAAAAPQGWTMCILSVSTICKTMCGMSAGATKGRITQHFSRANMADLTAKESTQETLVCLLGMIGGMVLAHFLNGLQEDSSTSSHYAEFVTWIVFLLLTVIHIWANTKGIKLLKFTTLNRQRATVVLDDLLSLLAQNDSMQLKLTSDGTVMENGNAVHVIAIPTPSQISESLLSSTWDLFFPTIVLGERKFHPQHYPIIPDCFSKEKYMVGYNNNHNRKKLYVSLCVGATTTDQLKAFVHVVLLHKCMQQGGEWTESLLQR